MTETDLIAELRELVRIIERRHPAEHEYAANKARDFLRAHHSAIEAAVRDADIRRQELARERACRDRLVQHLVGIHALLYPPPIEVDGKVCMFRPRLIDPHELMQELSDRIRAVPDEIDAAIAAQHNSAREG